MGFGVVHISKIGKQEEDVLSELATMSPKAIR